MSLRVWLPLNGTLENKGLSDVNLNFSPIYITGGKIGNKCLASQLGWFEIPDMAGKKQMSFAYWVKINTATSTNWLDTFSWYSTDGTNNYRNRQEFYTNSTRTNIWYKASQANSTNSSFVNTVGKWNHYAFTIDYNRGEACFYINGEITGTRKTNIDTTSYIKGTGSAFLLRENGLDSHINDFRLYDHILSPLEVKQISQGLILHYPLNNNSTNNNIEYDCSGYCNNGIKIGNFQYSDDTPKYNYSTHFKATNQKIYIDNLTTTGFSNSYSFAWWGKRASNSPMFWGFSNGVRLNGMYLGNLWNTGDGSNNPIYEPNTTTTITAPSVNIWHHYIMIGDGTTCKLYLNGELYGQAKTYKSISGTSIYINGWDSSARYSHDNMDISDFRIYCTALSAEDVLSLYNNSAYIDNQGNIYGAMYEEV